MAARKKKQHPALLDDIGKSNWDSIFRDVDKREVPVELLDNVIINFIDGTQVIVDVQEMLAEGMDPGQIELKLNARLVSLDNVIKDVDFHIVRDRIISTISLTTQRLLKRVG